MPQLYLPADAHRRRPRPRGPDRRARRQRRALRRLDARPGAAASASSPRCCATPPRRRGLSPPRRSAARELWAALIAAATRPRARPRARRAAGAAASRRGERDAAAARSRRHDARLPIGPRRRTSSRIARTWAGHPRVTNRQRRDLGAGRVALGRPPQARLRPRAAAAAGARRAAVAAAAAPAASSPSGGLAPSRAHGSSNSTRHLPSSPCCSASRARNDLPERPLKPVTGRAVRPVAISSLATAMRQRLARLALPDHEAAARVLARPAREALAVLDDVLPADRARAEVGPRDADVLELGVELGAPSRRRTRRCRAMKRSRVSSPCSIRPSRCSQSPVSPGDVSACPSSRRMTFRPFSVADERAAVALDVADVDQPLDDRRARGRRADARVLHRLAQLVVVDELAGRLHRAPAATRRSSAAAAWSPSPPRRPRACRPPRPARASAAPAPRPRRRPARRAVLEALAVDAAPARHEQHPAARAEHVLARPSSPGACSRTRPRDGRRRGSGARPGRRCACRRRSSSPTRCSARSSG